MQTKRGPESLKLLYGTDICSSWSPRCWFPRSRCTHRVKFGGSWGCRRGKKTPPWHQLPGDEGNALTSRSSSRLQLRACCPAARHTVVAPDQSAGRRRGYICLCSVSNDRTNIHFAFCAGGKRTNCRNCSGCCQTPRCRRTQGRCGAHHVAPDHFCSPDTEDKDFPLKKLILPIKILLGSSRGRDES